MGYRRRDHRTKGITSQTEFQLQSQDTTQMHSLTSAKEAQGQTPTRAGQTRRPIMNASTQGKTQLKSQQPLNQYPSQNSLSPKAPEQLRV